MDGSHWPVSDAEVEKILGSDLRWKESQPSGPAISLEGIAHSIHVHRPLLKLSYRDSDSEILTRRQDILASYRLTDEVEALIAGKTALAGSPQGAAAASDLVVLTQRYGVQARLAMLENQPDVAFHRTEKLLRYIKFLRSAPVDPHFARNSDLICLDRTLTEADRRNCWSAQHWKTLYNLLEPAPVVDKRGAERLAYIFEHIVVPAVRGMSNEAAAG